MNVEASQAGLAEFSLVAAKKGVFRHIARQRLSVAIILCKKNMKEEYNEDFFGTKEESGCQRQLVWKKPQDELYRTGLFTF